ncbi:MAG: hypothetical protein C0417_08750 [Chlorobiaceae bacterium]|nr:hypothetical protein [Chlorobiaceae bacterium]
MDRIFLNIFALTIAVIICGDLFQPVVAQTISGEGPPIVKMPFITIVTGNTAKIETFVVPNGAEVTVWIEWGVSLSYTEVTAPETFDWIYGASVYRNLYGLNPLTKIHLRVVAQNKYGITYGMDTTFTTLSEPILSEPIFVHADSITQTSARLHVKCRLHGADTWIGFYGGTKMNESLYEFRYVYIGSGDMDVETTFVVSGLIPNTVYNIEMDVYSHSRWITSNEQTFSTCNDSAAKGLLVPVKVKDMKGRINTRRFGIHTMATDCEDRKLDELELPPLPPSTALEARFLVKCIGLGTYTDIRQYISPTQIDTYKLRFQTDAFSGYPITISWPDLDSLYAGRVIMKISSDSLDMKTINSCDIIDPDLGLVKIIAEAPRPIAGVPNVITENAAVVGHEHGQINAQVNPAGLATNGWFEWGPSISYGRTTLEKGVGNEAGHIPMNEFIFGLQNNTQYHYRAVAQNSSGTIYGDDQTFITTEPTGVEILESMPSDYFLYQNYPNPLNPSTIIQYHLPAESRVSLKIFNLLGQLVSELLNEDQPVGLKTVEWNGSEYAAGIYYYKLSAITVADPRKTFSKVRTMLLIK